MQFVQCHFCTEFFADEVCTGNYFVAFYISVECTRFYSTAVRVSAVSTVSLYCSLFQRVRYRDIIVL